MDAQLGWSVERWASIISLIAAAIACFKKKTPDTDAAVLKKLGALDLKVQLLENEFKNHKESHAWASKALADRRKKRDPGVVES